MIDGLAAWYEAVDDDAVLVKAVQPALLNADFSAWTGDDPDNWAISAEDANNYVTEAIGGARLVSSGTIMQTTQVIQINGNRYLTSIEITDAVFGQISEISGGVVPGIIGVHSLEYTSLASSYGWKRLGACDITYRNAVLTNLSRTQWNPKAGSLGGNLAQSTPANQPWWSSNGTKFDGVSDYIESSLPASSWSFLHDPNGCTIALVYTQHTDIVGYLLSSYSTTTTKGINIYRTTGFSGSLGLLIANGTGVIAASGAITDSASIGLGKHLILIRLDSASASNNTYVRVNGVVQSTTLSCGTRIAGDASFPLYIGRRVVSPPNNNNMTLNDLIIYDNSLSINDMVNVEQYLANKHNITLP